MKKRAIARLTLELLEDRTLPSAGVLAGGTIRGTVFEDFNGNGRRDRGDVGRDGWQVQLIDSLGQVVQTVTTADGGRYAFHNVPDGRYIVQEVLQTGWRQTLPDPRTIPRPRRDVGDHKHKESSHSHHHQPGPELLARSGAAPLLPDLTVDTVRGLSDWFIDGQVIRFSQATPNIGSGPMYLRGGPDQGDGTQIVFQRIYNEDGTFSEREAGRFTFHPQHGHLHFDGYSQYFLREALPDADNDGIPEVGNPVAGGHKVSFCLVDVAVYDSSLPNFDPNGSGFGCGQTQVISVGWEDIYDANLFGQEIDISNVQPGQYWLEAVVDGDNHLQEIDETNNVGRVLVTIPVAPRPGTYNVNVRGQVVEGRNFGNFKNITITGNVFDDLNGNGQRDLPGDRGLGHRVVYLDQNQNGRFDAGQATIASTDVPQSIPDEGRITSRLNVRGLGYIQDINVTLDIRHTYNADLDVFLVSPRGTRVKLFTDIGEDQRHFTNTTLDDEATIGIAGGIAPFTGSFKPEGRLADFDGESANGEWRLEIRDDAAQDSGRLRSWSLTITHAEINTETNDEGQFRFAGLGLGVHRVRTALPPSWTQTSLNPAPFRATVSGASLAGVSFGTRDVPPRVLQVLVGNTNRNPALTPIPVGSGVQLQPLPWTSLNQIAIRFTEAVTVQAADLNLTGVVRFHYNPNTFTAVWTLARPLPAGRVTLRLSDQVVDPTGYQLDGEWDNPTSRSDTQSSRFPSGDGVAGGAFEFTFRVGAPPS